MKLLYAPLNEPGSEQIGPEKAFRRAFDSVTIFDYRALGRAGDSAETIGTKFVNMASSVKPDVIHLQVQDSGQIPPDSITEVKRRIPHVFVSHWTGDVRSAVSPYLSNICKTTDLTLIASTGQIGLFKRAGAPEVRYWQVGIDPEIDIPSEDKVEEWRKNHGIEKIVFLANHYGNRFPASRDRLSLAKAMRAEFGDDFGLYGASWPKELKARRVAYRKQGIVSAGAMVTLAMNHFHGISGWYSDRTALAIAAGSCHLTHAVPGIEKEYEPEKEIMIFQTVNEAIRLASDLLTVPELARRIGKAGQERALKEHTWDHRIQEYKRVVESLRRVKV